MELKGDIFCIGDIHRDIAKTVEVIIKYDVKNATIIALGDFGIFRYRDYKEYLPLDLVLQKRNIMLYTIRGNHDNPMFFNDSRNKIIIKFWNKFKNIKFLSDFTKFNINNKRCIAIGGAVSIDRCVRRSWVLPKTNSNPYINNDWWYNEVIPNMSNIQNENIDILFTHVGYRPPNIAPLTKDNCSFFKFDSLLKFDLDEEAKQLEKIIEKFNPKQWFFGHFHTSSKFLCGDCDCRALDICELLMIN